MVDVVRPELLPGRHLVHAAADQLGSDAGSDVRILELKALVLDLLVPDVSVQVEDLHTWTLRHSRSFLDSRAKAVRSPNYHGSDGSGTRRGAGEGRQDRASPRGIPRGDRARSGVDRAEPGGRRADRARSAPARRRAPRGLD